MNAPRPKASSRRAVPEGIYLCLACEHEAFAAPCVVRGCDRWFVVCPRCPDEYDRYVETGGRCPYCRVQ
jgi:hypothetical protein